jgi:hypothetical protein
MHTQHGTTVSDYAVLLDSIRQVAAEAHIAGWAVRDTIRARSEDSVAAGRARQPEASGHGCRHTRTLHHRVG